MSARRWGAALAVLVVVLDQISKAAAVRSLGDAGGSLGPFVNLVLARNAGISFSLFAHAPGAARWALLAFTLVAIALIAVWLSKARSAPAAIGLGFVLGGAVGNGIDRVFQGSVVDFLDPHFGAWHPFVFNLADAAISVGAAVLVWDGLFGAGRTASQGQSLT